MRWIVDHHIRAWKLNQWGDRLYEGYDMAHVHQVHKAQRNIPGRAYSGAVLLVAIASLLIACGGGPTGRSPNTAVLAWDAVADPDVAGYRIYYGTSPLTYTHSLDMGDDTIGIVTGLSSATRYYFAATAYSTLNDESVISNEVFKDIP